ncbi:hypothetical protein HPB52_004555 [Rhipicephalus sanguineus]|uniref:Endonuclease/exonuclease/phosphatase domain-containing protein n=1 Tax=Rhipicephalus sanguineus TaxID=34632 RepID=A0A9D4PU20_RHISA|nr:hypothetical protein HPB52_004555 [Rhipicephalus sanguineus]
MSSRPIRSRIPQHRLPGLGVQQHFASAPYRDSENCQSLVSQVLSTTQRLHRAPGGPPGPKTRPRRATAVLGLATHRAAASPPQASMEVVQVQGMDMHPSHYDPRDWTQVLRAQAKLRETRNATHGTNADPSVRETPSQSRETPQTARTPGLHSSSTQLRVLHTTAQKIKQLPPLPPDGYEVVFRSQGGLDLTILQPRYLLPALMQAAALTDPSTLTSDSAQDALKLVQLQHITYDQYEYAMTAYIAPPDGSVRNVITNAYWKESPQELLADLISRNPHETILDTRRMGLTRSILITFGQATVPRKIVYGGGLHLCTPYTPRVETCSNCRTIGHRTDVCIQPRAHKCPRCGQLHPKEANPTCIPVCIICEGPHLSGTRECKHRHLPKVTRPTSPREPRSQERVDNSLRGASTKHSEPPAGQRKGRSKSSDQPTWADKLKTPNGTRPPATNTPPAPDPRDQELWALRVEDMQHQAKLPSYHAVHSDSTDTPRVSTLIHRTLTYQQHTITSSTPYVLIEIIPTKHNTPPIFIANIYNTPRQAMATLDALLQRIHRIAGRNPLLIGGDFNSQHTDWGYRYTTARGRRLWTTIQYLRLTTHNFHTPTRIGNSITMDTSPDLTLSRSLKDISWSRTQHTLGSDHYIIAIQIPLTPHRPRLLTHNLIHWDAIRSARRELPNSPIQDIDDSVSSLLNDITAHTQHITTPPDTPTLYIRLAHLWEAHHSILERRKRQKHSRTLKRRLATLQTQITAHAAELCRSNWGQVCNSTAGNLSTKYAWHLLRHLINPTNSRTTSHCTPTSQHHAFPRLPFGPTPHNTHSTRHLLPSPALHGSPK